MARAYVDAFYAGLPEPSANFTLISAAKNVANFRQEIFKLDHVFTNKLTGFYRFQNDVIPTVDAQALFSSGAPLPGSPHTDRLARQDHVFRATYTASPQIVLDGGYTYSYGAILSTVTGLINTNNTSSINVPLPFPNQRGRVTTLTGHGFTGITGFGPYDNFSNNHAAFMNVSWIAGSHTTKFGAAFSRYLKHENALGGFNEGQFSALTTASRPPDHNRSAARLNTTAQLQASAVGLVLQGDRPPSSSTASTYGDCANRNWEAYRAGRVARAPEPDALLRPALLALRAAYDGKPPALQLRPRSSTRTQAMQV